MSDGFGCAARLVLTALPGLPFVRPGDDLAKLVLDGLAAAEIALAEQDVIVVTSKVVSRAEGRAVALGSVEAGERARELAPRVGKDPRLVELILRESTAVSRVTPSALVVRHRLGMVIANAGIDQSNVAPGEDAAVLLLPLDPDASAARLRDELRARSGVAPAIVITDSHGRPFRLGTVGAAIGACGLPPLWDQRGDRDLFGRTLQATITALADQVAAAADLVAGQAAEARPVVHVRGLRFPPSDRPARDLVRPADEDLYA